MNKEPDTNILGPNSIEGQIQDLWNQLSADRRKQLLGQLQMFMGDGVIGAIEYDSDEEMQEDDRREH